MGACWTTCVSHALPDEAGRLLSPTNRYWRCREGDGVPIKHDVTHLLPAHPIRHQAQLHAMDHGVVWNSYVPQYAK